MRTLIIPASSSRKTRRGRLVAEEWVLCGDIYGIRCDDNAQQILDMYLDDFLDVVPDHSALANFCRAA